MVPDTCELMATVSGWISVIRRSQPLAYSIVSAFGRPSPVKATHMPFQSRR